ncbi:scavenger receptor class f member 2-like protein [Lasius niger]|uniref:Scavenger receptor class f member 2-like protein n=1 Tax=Lasius niger TaxID=67767 RepID=A0A0J7K8X1_LASNI|nr:scavenger receptor class f member 2-like protein [Lasius niger]
MYISDVESGHRTVFEGSPSETQEDTENKTSNKRIILSQKRKRKRKSPPLILDTSEEELDSPELRDKRDRAIADELRNIKEMTTTSLADLLISWINECEGVRRISTSFKGELSGKLRDRLTRMRIGVTALEYKATSEYDAATLKIDNNILHIKLEDLQKQNDDLRKEMAKLKSSIEQLTTATSTMVNSMVHHTTQTSPPVLPLPPRGKPLPQRDLKKYSPSHIPLPKHRSVYLL